MSGHRPAAVPAAARRPAPVRPARPVLPHRTPPPARAPPCARTAAPAETRRGGHRHGGTPNRTLEARPGTRTGPGPPSCRHRAERAP
ncbi:hypothetical protein KCH_44010 [Kitasatospora cheerisanensis KCTC 2395]|uniref:Uncharacterized protein n=1 Tax=Kitasatospora cheerisanensis KCTC 2395 TaxID=1348663 RepID=A0A066YRB8_9ACTN|nr:hypothetical protein KCH_44010 [Kitasatospora cheerisanensis KCTC 2395]